jgi:putative endonuclease
MSFYCYILECADGTYYTGWTVNPEQRAAVHNKGRGARYTRTRCPVKLVYVEELPDRKSAMKREIAIKRMKRERKMKLIGGRVVRGEKKKEKSMDETS